MKFNYTFSNLCGTVYRGGNLVFTPDGDSIYRYYRCVCCLGSVLMGSWIVDSPVGNRVSSFDLVHNKSLTFPFENRTNVARVVVSPDGNTLLTIDEDGRGLLIAVRRRSVLHHHSFKAKVITLQHGSRHACSAVQSQWMRHDLQWSMCHHVPLFRSVQQSSAPTGHCLL